jgi:mercuric ion transport protein
LLVNFRSASTACAPGDVCAVPQVKRVQKLLFGVVVALVLIALAFPYVAPWFY